jgi:hypothetical protein
MKKNQNIPVSLRKILFGSAKRQSLQWLVKGAATTCTGTKECNKYDPTASDWPIIMIGAGRSLLVVPHLFAVPVSVLWVGLQKSK